MQQSSSSKGSVRPIHYLGSKLRLLGAIDDSLSSLKSSAGFVCDLFAGSGTVTAHLCHQRPTIASDIQEYSRVLCRASASYSNDIPSVKDLASELAKARLELDSPELGLLLSYESKCIRDALAGSLVPLYDIIEHGSIYTFRIGGSEGVPEELEGILKIIEPAAGEVTDGFQSLMVLDYFGGLYYSYAQAVDIDAALRVAFNLEGLARDKVLAAIVSAASELVNTVGKQFAQPLRVYYKDGRPKTNLARKVIGDRQKSFSDHFLPWYEYYRGAGSSFENRFILADYRVALEQLMEQDVGAIYADPPYTRYHYSRYYHVLETMCLHDSPDVSTTFQDGLGGLSRAVYRADRHQSPFCINSKSHDAFVELFRLSSRISPLILSYSPFEASGRVTPRLQTIDELMDIAGENYKTVHVIDPGEFTHSKLNRSDLNFGSNHHAELLLVCE